MTAAMEMEMGKSAFNQASKAPHNKKLLPLLHSSNHQKLEVCHTFLISSQTSKSMDRVPNCPAPPQIKKQAEDEGTLLPQNHPSVRRVEIIARRIIKSALEGKGGGFQGHMKVHMYLQSVQSSSSNANCSKQD